MTMLPLRVLFDSEQKKIVYAEAGERFVDGLCKLLRAKHLDLEEFAAPLPEGGYPNDGDWATSMPFAQLRKR
jgi:hypothetical protein